mgnify:CR=1 FL=1
MTILRAPSKTFFLGEYAVLSHGHAIVMATKPYFTLEFKQDQTSCPLKGPINDFAIEHDLKGWHWHDPHEQLGGLGASSAVFAMALYHQQSQTQNDLNNIELFESFKRYHQNQTPVPSGADLLCQLHGGLTLINCPDATAHAWPFKSLAWSIYRTGLTSQTHKVLQYPSSSASMAMNQIVLEGKKAIKESNEQLMLQTISAYHDAMQNNQCYDHQLKPVFSYLNEAPEILSFKGCGALGIDTFLVLYDQNHTHNVHQHLDSHFSRIAHTPDIAHGIHEYQEVYV